MTGSYNGFKRPLQCEAESQLLWTNIISIWLLQKAWGRKAHNVAVRQNLIKAREAYADDLVVLKRTAEYVKNVLRKGMAEGW